jgi:hypothetical protein
MRPRRAVCATITTSLKLLSLPCRLEPLKRPAACSFLPPQVRLPRTMNWAGVLRHIPGVTRALQRRARPPKLMKHNHTRPTRRERIAQFHPQALSNRASELNSESTAQRSGGSTIAASTVLAERAAWHMCAGHREIVQVHREEAGDIAGAATSEAVAGCAEQERKAQR